MCGRKILAGLRNWGFHISTYMSTLFNIYTGVFYEGISWKQQLAEIREKPETIGNREINNWQIDLSEKPLKYISVK